MVRSKPATYFDFDSRGCAFGDELMSLALPMLAPIVRSTGPRRRFQMRSCAGSTATRLDAIIALHNKSDLYATSLIKVGSGPHVV